MWIYGCIILVSLSSQFQLRAGQSQGDRWQWEPGVLTVECSGQHRSGRSRIGIALHYPVGIKLICLQKKKKKSHQDKKIQPIKIYRLKGTKIVSIGKRRNSCHFLPMPLRVLVWITYWGWAPGVHHNIVYGSSEGWDLVLCGRRSLQSRQKRSGSTETSQEPHGHKEMGTDSTVGSPVTIPEIRSLPSLLSPHYLKQARVKCLNWTWESFPQRVNIL